MSVHKIPDQIFLEEKDIVYIGPHIIETYILKKRNTNLERLVYAGAKKFIEELPKKSYIAILSSFSILETLQRIAPMWSMSLNSIKKRFLDSLIKTGGENLIFGFKILKEFEDLDFKNSENWPSYREIISRVRKLVKEKVITDIFEGVKVYPNIYLHLRTADINYCKAIITTEPFFLKFQNSFKIINLRNKHHFF